MGRDFEWNEDAMSELMNDIGVRLGGQMDAVYRRVSEEYLGKPVDEVKSGLRLHWAAGVDTCPMQDPLFSQVAELISNGQRVWLEGDGIIMADDAPASE